MRLKLTGANTYTGPLTGGASTGTILSRGDVFDFSDEAAEKVLTLTAFNHLNHEVPLFTKVEEAPEAEAAPAGRRSRRTPAPSDSE